MKELRLQTGMSKKEFSLFFSIPYHTIQNWESDTRKCSDYLKKLVEYKIEKEKIKKENFFNFVFSPCFHSFKELRKATGKRKAWFSDYFDIPYRTIQNWESEKKGWRKCPGYLLELMEYKLKKEGIVKSE